MFHEKGLRCNPRRGQAVGVDFTGGAEVIASRSSANSTFSVWNEFP